MLTIWGRISLVIPVARLRNASRLLGAALALMLACVASGQELSIPFEMDVGADFDARGEVFWALGSANRALESGYHAVARGLAERALDSYADMDEATRLSLEMVRVDALLGLEEYDAAGMAIEDLRSQGDSPRLQLRSGLLSLANPSADAIEIDALKDIDVGELGAEERAWLWTLRGWKATLDGKRGDSREAFGRATEIAASASPYLVAHIDYIRFRSKLSLKDVDESTIDDLRDRARRQEGKEIGYLYAQQLAVMLNDANQVSEAISLIQTELSRMPQSFGLFRDEFLVLQLIIAGVDRVEGRLAAEELLRLGEEASLMRIGLQRVASECMAQGAERMEFMKNTLSGIIDSESPHPLLDEALYYRSVASFFEEDYESAEDGAAELGRRYPNSEYKKGMLTVLAASAWGQSRYRTAASYLVQLRSEFPDPDSSASISALIADCYFKAGGFSQSADVFLSAAEAYAIAFQSMEAGPQAGAIFAQLIDSYLSAGRIEEALSLLDDPDTVEKSGDSIRWRSEWSILNAMRAADRADEAYERIQTVLRSIEDAPKLELRFFWLATKLSMESGRADETAAREADLKGFLESAPEGGFDADTVRKVKSSALLTLAESKLANDLPDEANEDFERLRQEYPGSGAALYSYIVQARYYSSINLIVEAQRLLIYMADNFPESPLAPQALYEAALNAERRGQEAVLNQANQLLERIATDYPESDMLFYARLKQADLLRRLNQFGGAQQIYEFLENRFRDRPDRFLAQISLADTLMAQASKDPAKFEAAISRLELLLDLREVPIDLRVEAGYKLGVAWRSQSEVEKAKRTLWLIYDMLVSQDQIEKIGHKGRYWLSRSLFELAELAEAESDLDQARSFYELVVDARLWAWTLARAQLDRMDGKVEPTPN